jgi:hypothetical protein
MRKNALYTILRSSCLTLVGLFCLYSFETRAGSSQCLHLFEDERGVRDSSIELEYPLDEKTIHIYTTSDGTLGGLYKNVSDIDPTILAYLKNQDVLKFEFDKLPPNLRILAARQGIIAGKYKFGRSAGGHRKIKGLIVKEQYREMYDLIAGVDLGSPETVNDGKLIESHMRSDLKPGDLVLKAAKFQAALKYKPGPMHMHVLFKMDTKWLQSNPVMNPWRQADYWRRANLTMEMRDVFESGNSLRTNTTQTSGPLIDQSLHTVLII